MKTIRVTKEVRKLLQEYEVEGSVDVKVNALLDDSVERDGVFDDCDETTNIWIDESTLNRLDKYKLSKKERHSDTLYRLFLEIGDRRG